MNNNDLNQQNVNKSISIVNDSLISQAIYKHFIIAILITELCFIYGIFSFLLISKKFILFLYLNLNQILTQLLIIVSNKTF